MSTDLREASRSAGTMCLRGGGWEHPYQADPIIKPHWSQGLNRYAYAHNNPLNWIDPTGFETEDEEEELPEDEKGEKVVDAFEPRDFELDSINAHVDSSSDAGNSSSADAGTDDGASSDATGDVGTVAPPAVQDEPDSGAQDTLDDSAQAASDQGSEDWRNAPYAGITVDNEIVPNAILHEATPQIQDSSETWETTLVVMTAITPGPGTGEGLIILSVRVARGARAGFAAAGGAGSVALDTNALIAAVEHGQAATILVGRSPVIPITVAKEFLRGGSPAALRSFLAANGGRIAAAGSEASARAFQAQATSLGRVLGTADARVVAGAQRERLGLVTNDKSFGNFLRAIGFAVEGF